MLFSRKKVSSHYNERNPSPQKTARLDESKEGMVPVFVYSLFAV